MANSQSQSQTGKIANILSEIQSRQKIHNAFLSYVAHHDNEYAHSSVNSDSPGKGKGMASIGGKA